MDFRASVAEFPERLNPAPTRLNGISLSVPIHPRSFSSWRHPFLLFNIDISLERFASIGSTLRQNLRKKKKKKTTVSTLSCIQFCHRSSAAPSTMAIHPSFPSQADVRGPLSSQQAQAISAWTEQAAASLGDLRITDSTPRNEGNAALRGTSLSLSIPLDDPVPATDASPNPRVRIVGQIPEESRKIPAVTFRRREPLRRDSLKRREALLKGKDGSRRRQRWENGMS